MGRCGKVLTDNRNGVTFGKKPDTAPPSHIKVGAAIAILETLVLGRQILAPQSLDQEVQNTAGMGASGR